MWTRKLQAGAWKGTALRRFFPFFPFLFRYFSEVGILIGLLVSHFQLLRELVVKYTNLLPWIFHLQKMHSTDAVVFFYISCTKTSIFFILYFTSVRFVTKVFNQPLIERWLSTELLLKFVSKFEEDIFKILYWISILLSAESYNSPYRLHEEVEPPLHHIRIVQSFNSAYRLQYRLSNFLANFRKFPVLLPVQSPHMFCTIQCFVETPLYKLEQSLKPNVSFY